MQAPLPFKRSRKPDLPAFVARGESGRMGQRRTALPIRLLVVADGYRYLGHPSGLDFSTGPTGLSRFLASLLEMPFPARFEIALAHLDQRDGAAMMDFDPRIRCRMPCFAFDDPAQFHADRFDAVFLFGCVEKLSRDDARGQRRTARDGKPYPLDRLADTELAQIEAFQRGGGGLFMAGDIGRTGGLLGGGLPRACQMRRWTDRQRLGGSARAGGPGGNVIALRPPQGPPLLQHIHAASPPEGPRVRAGAGDNVPERPTAEEPDLESQFDGAFPEALNGGPRPLPQRVRAGPPGATGLCAYDGHRAGIGRTVTASTWRPFLNGALEEFSPPTHPANVGVPQAARDCLDARCAGLALWLARPGIADAMLLRG